jgi:hypothetical protein
MMFLLVIMFTLGDLSTILASPTGQPLPQIFLEATGTNRAAFGLFFLSEFWCHDSCDCPCDRGMVS